MTLATGVFDLADGRRVGYARTEQADGPVVVHCHGVPSNRWELALVEATLGRAGSDVQLLALNRPGYRPSDFGTLVADGGGIDSL